MSKFAQHNFPRVGDIYSRGEFAARLKEAYPNLTESAAIKAADAVDRLDGKNDDAIHVCNGSPEYDYDAYETIAEKAFCASVNHTSMCGCSIDVSRIHETIRTLITDTRATNRDALNPDLFAKELKKNIQIMGIELSDELPARAVKTLSEDTEDPLGWIEVRSGTNAQLRQLMGMNSYDTISDSFIEAVEVTLNPDARLIPAQEVPKNQIAGAKALMPQNHANLTPAEITEMLGWAEELVIAIEMQAGIYLREGSTNRDIILDDMRRARIVLNEFRTQLGRPGATMEFHRQVNNIYHSVTNTARYSQNATLQRNIRSLASSLYSINKTIMGERGALHISLLPDFIARSFRECGLQENARKFAEIARNSISTFANSAKSATPTIINTIRNGAIAAQNSANSSPMPAWKAAMWAVGAVLAVGAIIAMNVYAITLSKKSEKKDSDK